MRIGPLETTRRELIAVCVGAATFAGLLWFTPSPQSVQDRAAEVQPDREEVSVLCRRVANKYDSNGNYMLEPEEGVAMARALGYDKVLPTNQLIFQLEPCSRGNYDAYLRISNQGGNQGGLFADQPVFDDYHWVFLSTLKSVSR